MDVVLVLCIVLCVGGNLFVYTHLVLIRYGCCSCVMYRAVCRR
jgi:hypothetical protein